MSVDNNDFKILGEALPSGVFEIDENLKCIYSNESELKRFRQLLVNAVMATDIFDPDMKKLRDSRWKKAFSSGSGKSEADLKATIVIEHIIQAADVAVSVMYVPRILLLYRSN